MAARKTTEVNDTQQLPVSKENKVTIMVPKESGEEASFFIGLNGRNFLLPRGKRVEVPEDIAAIYNDHLNARDIADAYADQESKRMNKVEGAPV